jgi:hypothetical protein
MTQASYQDSQVSCTDTGLAIKHYYFPVGTKHISYAAIRDVTRMELTGLNSVRRWRIWGSGDFVHWWNLDMKRPGKTAALVLDIGHRICPTITPDDPDAVEQILTTHT